MSLVLTMRTANRAPKRNYVDGTLGRLHQQGVDLTALHLCATAPDVRWLEPLLASLPRPMLHVPDRVLGANDNGLAQVSAGLETDADWILLLEDDLSFCADFVGSVERWLARYARADRNLYRFFGFTQAPSKTTEAYDCPLKSLRASQAVALRRTDAEDFLAWGRANLRTWRKSPQGGGSTADPLIAFDKFLACWSLTRWPGRPGVISQPYFVKHIGDQSSLHRFGARNDRFYAGDRWSYRPVEASL